MGRGTGSKEKRGYDLGHYWNSRHPSTSFNYPGSLPNSAMLAENPHPPTKASATSARSKCQFNYSVWISGLQTVSEGVVVRSGRWRSPHSASRDEESADRASSQTRPGVPRRREFFCGGCALSAPAAEFLV